MSKQSKRIFQDLPMIELLLQKAVEKYAPTGDESLDPSIQIRLMEDVPDKADTFVTCLYLLAQDMCFGEWNDFWFDMGIRVFDAENEYDFPEDLPLEDFDEA